MNYSKPEVKTLGQATEVIEGAGKTSPFQIEPNLQRKVVPAYDLDE